MLFENSTISISQNEGCNIPAEPNLSISTNPISGKVEIMMEVNSEEVHQYLHLLKRMLRTWNFQLQHAHSFLLLTTREKEICKLITRGYTNEQMAQLLYISYETVKTHRKNTSRKLGCNCIQDLMQYAAFF
jgi:DNA-binding NarL/FixJ family response regulator